MLGNAASGPTCANGSEQHREANLQGLLDARQRLLDVGDTDAASSLTEAICARLRDQGDLARAAALGQATLEAMPSPSATAARWLHELGTIAQLGGDDAQAYDRHLLAAAMFSEVGDTAGVARCYDSLGTLAHARGDYQQAEHYYQAAMSFHAPQHQPLAQAQPPVLDSPHAELTLTDIAPANPAANGRWRGRRAGPPGQVRRAVGMRPAVLAAGTVVVAATVAIAAIASGGSAGSVADRTDPAGTGLAGGAQAGAAAAGGARVQAAAWAARQVSSSAVVSCDPAMCDALRAQGVAAGNLLAIGAEGQSDPLGSDIVVATAAVRGTLGDRLAQVYAPLVLAGFGNGSARIEVRVTAPDGSAAYLRALRADRAARETAGRQLLANRRLSVPAGPGRQLAHGQVDSRLLTTIAALTAVRRLRIVAFAVSGPGADPRVPLPSAEIAAPGSGRTGAVAALSAVAAFLRAQRSPYLAAVISLTRLPSGQPLLRVAFGEPSPLGLLGPAG